MWSDGLVSQRWSVFPDRRGRRGHPRSLPAGSVFVKTLSIPDAGGKPAQPVETQVLHRYDREWRAYSYAWNEERSDAVLVDRYGMDRTIDLPSGRQRHRFSSRSECLVCHNFQAGYVLGFDRNQRSSKRNTVASLEDHARDYLHANCAHCHRPNGGGLVPMRLERSVSLMQMEAIKVAPQRGDFGIPNACVISPGSPEQSTLWYRMAKLGSGRMPHMGFSEN